MKALWEILVPTVKNLHAKVKKRFYRKRYHKLWDAHVRAMSGGLTVLPPTTNGEWVSPTGEIFSERMIPVRIFCTEDEINAVSDFTAKHYNQQAVMFYVVSDRVTIKNYPSRPILP
jgi:hypothetical protein